MADTQPTSGASRDPDDDEDDRTVANIILVVGFLVLVGGGIWLANAMVDARKADECISAGRRNCNPIEVPQRYPQSQNRLPNRAGVLASMRNANE